MVTDLLWAAKAERLVRQIGAVGVVEVHSRLWAFRTSDFPMEHGFGTKGEAETADQIRNSECPVNARSNGCLPTSICEEGMRSQDATIRKHRKLDDRRAFADDARSKNTRQNILELDLRTRRSK